MAAYIEISTGYPTYVVEDLFKEKLDMVKCVENGRNEAGATFFKVTLKEYNTHANLLRWISVFRPPLDRKFAGWMVKFDRTDSGHEEVSKDIQGLKETQVKITPMDGGESYFVEGGNKAVTAKLLEEIGDTALIQLTVSQDQGGGEYIEFHFSGWEGGKEKTWTKFRPSTQR